MNKEKFDHYVEQMKVGRMPPTLGYQITFEQFCMFADAVSKNIERYGWGYYREYMNRWWIKVDPREIKKRKLIY